MGYVKIKQILAKEGYIYGLGDHNDKMYIWAGGEWQPYGWEEPELPEPILNKLRNAEDPRNSTK